MSGESCPASQPAGQPYLARAYVWTAPTTHTPTPPAPTTLGDVEALPTHGATQKPKAAPRRAGPSKSQP